MPMMIILSMVSAILRGDENHLPQFMNSQNMPLRPKVNQLANKAV
jgi:hypothetical protein